MIMQITMREMQLLNRACKRLLGAEEWARRSDIAWESLRGLEFVTADMLESALLDGMDISTGAQFNREEARMLRELAEYLMRGYVGPHAKTLEMIRMKVPR